jgi:DNA-directed RNA polymerase specialized sigma24 family protein
MSGSASVPTPPAVERRGIVPAIPMGIKYNCRMAVEPNVLKAARKYKSSAVEELFGAYYPTVYRLAYALCGEQSAARRVIDRVVQRALTVMPKWRDDGDADRWFYHYTVLETRRNEASGAGPDPLLDGNATPAYAAFLRALRGLPVQQREAIVLHHGERLNPRFIGVAMDCSMDAATNHLRAGTQHLEAMTGGQLAPLLQTLSQAHWHLAPPSQIARPEIRRSISRYLLPQRLRRRLLILAILAVAGAAWYWRAQLHRLL